MQYLKETKKNDAATASFHKYVVAVVKTIPAGTVLTYKQVACRAGNPNASRAVGAILHTNTDPAIPCHRVIRSDGTIGGYNKGVKEKIKKLRKEGAFPVTKS